MEKSGKAGEKEGVEALRRRQSSCRGKVFALQDCQRKHPREPERSMFCRHLNQAAALCFVSFACPAQVEAVQSYCSTAGTQIKRKQCAQAQYELQQCLADHQE